MLTVYKLWSSRFYFRDLQYEGLTLCWCCKFIGTIFQYSQTCIYRAL